MSGLVVAIPVRSFRDGKSRLAPVLDAELRADLVAKMLDHVCAVAISSDVVDRVLVVSPDPDVLGHVSRRSGEIIACEQPLERPGLDSAAEVARAAALRIGADRLLMLFGDLPVLEPNDLRLIAETPADVVIATDWRGTGSNGLLLDLQQSENRVFSFSYGPDSALRHAAESQRLGLDVVVSTFGGVAFDLDTIEDAIAIRESGRELPGWLEQLSFQPQEIRA